jgi:hypothetical protein
MYLFVKSEEWKEILSPSSSVVLQATLATVFLTGGWLV